MSKLTDKDVRHIAKLARLELSDKEVPMFTEQLSSILTYIDQLNEVNTENVEPLKQVTGLQNMLREDSIAPTLASPDDLLNTSPLPIVDHQIQTPSAHG